MKKRYLYEMKEGQEFEDTFLVVSKDLKNKKDGGKFLVLEIADKSGSVKANMWDNFLGVVDGLQVNDFIMAVGRVGSYNGKMQITIQRLQKLDPSQVDLADFIRKSKLDIDALLKELKESYSKFNNVHLKALLNTMLNDPEISTRLPNAPAAKSLHNAYIGGLVEHLYSMSKIAEFICGHYHSYGINIDREILLTGVFLHDLAKLDELEYQLAIKYSDQGQLIGHITLAAQYVERFTSRIKDFPADLKMVLTHLVTSHHGEKELGSPRSPMTLEAIMLNALDVMDSRAWGFQKMFEDTAETESWTGQSYMFGNQALYLGHLDTIAGNKVATPKM